uniref:Uncharacterized protein n=1 Tax=Avena sativa TaxID=4498 RepID=A0ACD5VXP0_AVESA
MTESGAASASSAALSTTTVAALVSGASTAPFIPPSLAALLASSSMSTMSHMAPSSSSRPLHLGIAAFSGGFFPSPQPTIAPSAPLVSFAAVSPAASSTPPAPSMAGFTAAPYEAPVLPFSHAVSDAPAPMIPEGAVPAPYQLANLITVRLTQYNYLYWRAQILPLLRSRHLDGFVDGSFPCPPRSVAAYTADGMRSSLTESVAGLVLFAASSYDIWSTFEHSYSQQSEARGTALRRQLGDCKKLNSSAHDFFHKVKTLSDTLTSIGQPLCDAEFTEYVLHGLDSNYNNMVEHVNGRETLITPRDLYSRLMYTEARVEERCATHHVDLTANTAHRGAPVGSRAPVPCLPPGPPTGGSGQWQPRQPPSPNTGGRQRPTCQLCGILGHLASKCHRRFKRDFLGIENDGRGNEKQAAIADSYYGQTPSYSLIPSGTSTLVRQITRPAR